MRNESILQYTVTRCRNIAFGAMRSAAPPYGAMAHFLANAPPQGAQQQQQQVPVLDPDIRLVTTLAGVRRAETEDDFKEFFRQGAVHGTSAWPIKCLAWLRPVFMFQISQREVERAC